MTGGERFVLERRIAFLCHELDCLGDQAHEAEQGLRLNPTDVRGRQRLTAIYALAAEMWSSIVELKSRHEERAPPRVDDGPGRSPLHEWAH